MPIIPTFQGGVPQVRDNSGSGMVPAQAITPKTDYAAVLKEALKPINDTANSISQALKINHARTVKAESDDAETRVIQTINAYMNDPENGYLQKNGKNAMDGFEPLVNDMRKDIQNIVGQLQPATRDAIESRINDRLTTAIGQAQRWNTRQTQEYHLSSSKARVETLLDDAANHYADAAYLSKTWGSIEDELDYQAADFAGMPPEAAKQMKDQTFALFQSKRFASWAQDDPVMAFAAFRNEKKNIDPDIALKIENSLFGQSRDLMAYDLANAPLSYDKDGKLINAKWMDDPRAKTGNAFIDSLPPDQHLSVVAKAMQLRRSLTGQLQNQMKLDTANSLARVLTTGKDDDPLTMGQFVEVYGPKLGKKNFDQYQMDFVHNQTLYDFRGMSNDDIQSMLKAQKPASDSKNYAQEYKYWESKNKAAASIIKQRSADPIGYAIENELYGIQGLNFGNTGELSQQLEARSTALKNIETGWNVAPVLFSKAEASQLTSTLDKADIDGKLDILRTIAHATGASGVSAASEQLKSGSVAYSIAMSGIEDYGEDGSISVGEMYLRGKDAIEQKRVKVDTTAVYGLDSSIYTALGDEEGAEAVFTNPQTVSATAELVKGVWGYEALNGGSVNDALEKSVGTIYNFNGKKIVLPSGVSGFAIMGDDFDDLILKKAEDIKKEKKNFYAGGVAITPEEFAELLPDLKLQTYARNGTAMTYEVLYNGEAVRDSTGGIYLLTIGGEEE